MIEPFRGHMTKQQYRAFLLRLWRVTSENAVTWRVSLEESHTGERKGFADLESLVTFLKEQMGHPCDSPKPSSETRKPDEIVSH